MRGLEDVKRQIMRMDTEVKSPQTICAQTSWLINLRDTKDRRAFAKLFDFYAPRLKAMYMRGGLSPAEADDLIQDVMLTIWRKADQFDPQRAKASTWIYRIARNRHIDAIRREKRPLPDELAAPDMAQTEDSHEILALEQEAQKLKEALGRLNQSQRDMVEQAYLGDLSHSEIHQNTGLPLGTIKSRIRLALERLRHDLKGIR